MWIKCGDELNTCLKNVHQIFWPWKKFAKYLYFSNSIFTMMGAPEKKVILRFFSRHEVIYLWVKFQVSLTCPTGIFANQCHIFHKYLMEIFFPNLLRVFDQPKVEFSNLGQKWAITRSLRLRGLLREPKVLITSNAETAMLSSFLHTLHTFSSVHLRWDLHGVEN